MIVTAIPCAGFVNESERQAFEAVKQKLSSLPGSGEWIVLSNLSHSSSSHYQSDEIDMVVIGPQGLFVIEVKHWDRGWMRSRRDQVDGEADKLSNKVRRVATNARYAYSALGRVSGRVLLTAESKAIGDANRLTHRGVEFFTLKEIKELLDLDQPVQLPPEVVKALCKQLEPRTHVNLGELRRLGEFANLELSSQADERFHRIYRGVHARTQDKIILHLYDLSAREGKGVENLAAREFDTMQRLQKSPWVPRFRDSLQDLQGFAGEMKFFTVIDPCAPSIKKRSADPDWNTAQRIEFSLLAAHALGQLHSSEQDDATPIVHRNLHPGNIFVTARNSVLFAGFSLARVTGLETIAKTPLLPSAFSEFMAPEVRANGLSGADQRSDVYALGAALLTIFEGRSDDGAADCRGILQRTLADDPADRPTLEQLTQDLKALTQPLDITKSETLPPDAVPEDEPLPHPRYWSEDLDVEFNGNTFRIVSRLGSGGIGQTFKIVHVDRESGENYGTYVGKVINDEIPGNVALKAYQRVKAYTSNPNLSVIHETAQTWQSHSFVALLKWVEGDSLANLSGVLPLVAEESNGMLLESLLLGWCDDLCRALSRLHSAGLVHGDVSPANIIVHHGEVTLTDYDLVTPSGTASAGCGAKCYCSPQAEQRLPLSFSDDIFALAAALFKAVTDREPFAAKGAGFDKSGGLKWLDAEKAELPVFTEFASRATSPAVEQRFASAAAALDWLASKRNAAGGAGIPPPAMVVETTPLALTPNEVPWLKFILQVYPGSAYGNVETRGLDSSFAMDTYVETALEKSLYDDLLSRRARLVILCGNAGDGKTALLQHLAKRFGVAATQSAQRIWEAPAADGLKLKANLDGAASFDGQCANELLDEFFAPFMQGRPADDVAHLLAINDGRLLEWIDRSQAQGRSSPLVAQLADLLEREGSAAPSDSHIRLIDLNARSLVGDINADRSDVTTEFLDNLIEKLLGGESAAEKWKPCRSCSAFSRCQAGRNADVLLRNQGAAQRLRERLAEALQAVHQRAEVHITARELRATLSYILFGVHYCTELHEHPELRPTGYWNLAFDPQSELRQGDVLRELTFLDPALESHPMIDRRLAGQGGDETNAGPHYHDMPLDDARRRAFFEWQASQVQAVAETPDALGLAHGRHLRAFKEAGLRDAAANTELRDKLCGGISRLEELPVLALSRSNKGRVPLKVPPRTPGESIFWVEKPLGSFKLEAELPAKTALLPTLHRRLRLSYTYLNGHVEELSMGYELFHTLLELELGFQLNDTTSDDLFANLAIFTQRLAQEGDASLFAWNPQDDGNIYKIAIDRTGARQKLVCGTLKEEAS